MKQTPSERRRNAERRVTGRSICVGLSEPNDPKVVWTDGTGVAACGRTDFHGPHAAVPRIVAECWTCCGHTQHDESNITCQYKRTVPRLLSLGASAVCRAAGHDVRPVGVR